MLRCGAARSRAQRGAGSPRLPEALRVLGSFPPSCPRSASLPRGARASQQPPRGPAASLSGLDAFASRDNNGIKKSTQKIPAAGRPFKRPLLPASHTADPICRGGSGGVGQHLPTAATWAAGQAPGSCFTPELAAGPKRRLCHPHRDRSAGAGGGTRQRAPSSPCPSPSRLCLVPGGCLASFPPLVVPCKSPARKPLLLAPGQAEFRRRGRREALNAVPVPQPVPGEPHAGGAGRVTFPSPTDSSWGAGDG